MFRKIRNRENYKLIEKYSLLSLVGYAYVFSTIFLLVDLLHLNKTLSFFISYGSWYLMLYYLQLRFLFKTTHNNRKLIKFYSSILIFYVIANIIFNVVIFLKIHYLVATLLTVLLLMPLRLIVLKKYVYKD